MSNLVAKLFNPLQFCLILALVSCKTAEQLRREKLLDTLNVQMTQLQQHVTDSQGQVSEHESRLNQIYGQLEETQHEEKQRILGKERERIKTLEQLTVRLTHIEAKLGTLEAQSQQQTQFVKEVTKQLKLIQKKKPSRNKKRSQSPYLKAIELWQKKKNDQAKNLFLQALGNKKLSSIRWVRSHHALGLIHYQQKKYQQAMVHLSKVYTKYPKSSKAPESLLYIARSFLKIKQKKSAQESLQQLLTQYPKSKAAGEAKKVLKGI